MFRNEEEAEDYRRSLGRFSEEEDFKPYPADDDTLRYLLELHRCSHVVTPISWVGEEEPDYFTAENFMNLLGSSVPA